MHLLQLSSHKFRIESGPQYALDLLVDPQVLATCQIFETAGCGLRFGIEMLGSFPYSEGLVFQKDLSPNALSAHTRDGSRMT